MVVVNYHAPSSDRTGGFEGKCFCCQLKSRTKVRTVNKFVRLYEGVIRGGASKPTALVIGGDFNWKNEEEKQAVEEFSNAWRVVPTEGGEIVLLDDQSSRQNDFILCSRRAQYFPEKEAAENRKKLYAEDGKHTAVMGIVPMGAAAQRQAPQKRTLPPVLQLYNWPPLWPPFLPTLDQPQAAGASGSAESPPAVPQSPPEPPEEPDNDY